MAASPSTGHLFSKMPQPVHLSSLIMGRFFSSPTMARYEHCSLQTGKIGFRKEIQKVGERNDLAHPSQVGDHPRHVALTLFTRIFERSISPSPNS